MQSMKVPAIISSPEALNNALSCEASLIYIESALYLEIPEHIDRAMRMHGYLPVDGLGKKGIFFFRSSGPDAFDPKIHSIYDPLGIL